MKNEYGEPLTYDKNFSGPRQRNRRCTDVPCLLLFVLFLGGWGYIAQFAFRTGNLNKLVAPMDSFNRECGVDPGVENKSNLFFFDMTECLNPLTLLKGCETPRVSRNPVITISKSPSSNIAPSINVIVFDNFSDETRN